MTAKTDNRPRLWMGSTSRCLALVYRPEPMLRTFSADAGWQDLDVPNPEASALAVASAYGLTEQPEDVVEQWLAGPPERATA